jgi:hypothetical protein
VKIFKREVAASKPGFRKNLSTAIVLLTMAGTVESVAGSDLYRWKNSRGEPAYSDQPPPDGVDYEVVNTRPALTREAFVEDETTPERADSSDEGVSKKDLELCERARMNLVALETRSQLKTRNEQGEISEMSVEEKDALMQRTKVDIKIYCEQPDGAPSSDALISGENR